MCKRGEEQVGSGGQAGKHKGADRWGGKVGKPTENGNYRTGELPKSVQVASSDTRFAELLATAAARQPHGGHFARTWVNI